MASDFPTNIKQLANSYLTRIEKHFASDKTDALFYFGAIAQPVETKFRLRIEELAREHKKNPKDTLIVLLTTGGGSAETAEKFVNIIRHFYKNVYFIIPDYAMSAGTIFCMSGDKIYMDYSSNLGPIDPQIFSMKEKQYVPANGYLDEIELLLDKSRKNTLTNAEFVILQNQDLAFLNQCRQARELSEKLLEDWLVKYKFKDWSIHASNGVKVTAVEKISRAKQIAKELGNNKEWKVHSRPIKIDDLEKMKLKIDDYSKDKDLQNVIRQYTDFMLDYLNQFNPRPLNFIHTRLFI
ncbi:SDH family Clp fold serine proteinase [Endomicrobium proavitum]|uniref:Serine dehydrogenasease n=1 Tax=Endomicrobium proavitum TaxID=1408281 RepID=A0A0G3WJY0_9BACT|nr:hypothetical protein [Endomicrobium proavitum]AKL98613.1 hypothetical protein Epro_1234 [Endomicrobium proavitum]